MSKNQMIITEGILKRIPAPIQNLMWYLTMHVKSNIKLHEFSFVAKNNDNETMQHLTHRIEDLNYIKEYDFKSNNPISETVYICNDFTSTMLLAVEY